MADIDALCRVLSAASCPRGPRYDDAPEHEREATRRYVYEILAGRTHTPPTAEEAAVIEAIDGAAAKERG